MDPEPNASDPSRSGGAEQFIDLELRLCVEDGSASPSGYIRDRSGSEQPFRGWLGLLGLLEQATHTTRR
jgi:hypothetical protein